MTLEEFSLKCPYDQVAYIDITGAPSYAKWYIGFDMAFSGGKAAEYAYAVAWELGFNPIVNQGKFKGCDWPVEELYARLEVQP